MRLVSSRLNEHLSQVLDHREIIRIVFNSCGCALRTVTTQESLSEARNDVHDFISKFLHHTLAFALFHAVCKYLHCTRPNTFLIGPLLEPSTPYKIDLLALLILFENKVLLY